MKIGSLVEWNGTGATSTDKHELPYKKGEIYNVTDMIPHTLLNERWKSLGYRFMPGQYIEVDLYPGIYSHTRYFNEIQPPEEVNIEELMTETSLSPV